MPSSPPILLLDTNVWLDIYLPHRPQRDVALDLVREAANRDVPLTFASQSLLDVYQRVMVDNKRWARTSGRLTESYAIAIRRHAWDCAHEMQTLATAVPVDASDLYLASKFRDVHDDLEDDLVLAECQRAHADYLVTSDKQLLAHSPIDTRTPAHMLELLRSGLARGRDSSAGGKDELYWLHRWLSNDKEA